MTHMRSKSCYCPRCGGTSYVTANLEDGSIQGMDVTPLCHWPAQCPHEFVRGIFDRQFGSRLVVPKHGVKDL